MIPDSTQPEQSITSHQSGGAQINAPKIENIRDVAGGNIFNFVGLTGEDGERIRARQERRDALITILRNVITSAHCPIEPHELWLLCNLMFPEWVAYVQGVSRRQILDHLLERYNSMRSSLGEDLLILINSLTNLLPSAMGAGLRVYINIIVNADRQISVEELESETARIVSLFHKQSQMPVVILIQLVHTSDHGRYLITCRRTHPALTPKKIAPSPENPRGYSLQELPNVVANLIHDCEQADTASPGGFQIELALPFNLLCALVTELMIHEWPIQRLNKLTQQAEKHQLGARYPLVVKLSNDARRELGEPVTLARWRAKSQLLQRWSDASTTDMPRIVCPTQGHPCHWGMNEWYQRTVVAMVIDETSTKADDPTFQDALETMILSGVPIGIWPVPGVPHDSQKEYLGRFYAAERLRDLPIRLFQERGQNDPRALHTILYHDLWTDRLEDQWALFGAQEELDNG